MSRQDLASSEVDMKILIISDTHGHWKNIETVEVRERPDKVFFLGDGAEDTHVIQSDCLGVLGNCDFSKKMFNDQEVFDLFGIKILLIHGHFYDVKRGVGEIVAYALRNDIDVVCHGHTHIQFLDKCDGVIIFNPGSLWEGEYGILEINEKGLHFSHKKI